MGEIKDTVEAAKGILEAVPVYQDALQPAAKEIGKSLHTVAKLVNVALSPISILVWGYDTIAEYLQSRLEEKLKSVPPERIKEPNSSVAGPAVEALRFAMSEPDLREMYANLLATSMDRETAHKAHPAFVEIIRQMTADEAKIFSAIAADQTVYLPEIISGIPSHSSLYSQVTPSVAYKYRYLAEKSQCEFSDLIPSYLDNLRRLGITQHIHGEWLNFVYRPDGTADIYGKDLASFRTPEENADLVALLKHLLADEVSRHTDKDIFPSFSVYNKKVELTSWGEQFSDACVAPPKR